MNVKKCACLMCSLALAGAVVTGCIPNQARTNAPTPARVYIDSVHQVYDQVDLQMTALATASASSDSAAVFASLDEVDKQVAALEALEVPNGLENLQAQYISATKSLASSVRAYAEYRYQGGSSASDAAARLAAIQASYASGIEQLKAADALAKSM